MSFIEKHRVRINMNWPKEI